MLHLLMYDDIATSILYNFFVDNTYLYVYLMPMQTGLQAEERFHHSSESNEEHGEGLCEDDL